MQVFKCALRILRAHLIFPMIYIVGLSFMGILMASSFGFGQPGGEFTPTRGDFAVVNRDGGALSAGITEALTSMGDEVHVADERIAFQDAVAKGQVDYLLIVPAGYGDAFLEAVREGEEPPELECVYSFYSTEGAYLDEAVSEYLSIARTIAVAEPKVTQDQVASEALDTLGYKAEATLLSLDKAVSEADRFVFYLQWNTYTLFAGITVVVGLLTTTLGRTDVRRRSLVSPIAYIKYNLQLALACLTVALMAWAWSFGIGLIAFPAAVSAMSLPGVLWCALSMLAFCTLPLSVGFLLGQVGANIAIANGVGNITGLVVSFLGGAWVSLDLMSPEVLALAHCLPGYWYGNACTLAAHLPGEASLSELLPVMQDVGVLLLFALAIFSVALVLGRFRTQTAQSGGNAAAEVVI